MHLISKEDAALFKNFILSHDFFLIVGHKEPDGDCVSSCLGIASILKAFSKSYQLLSAGPFKRSEIKPYENLFSQSVDFLDENERKKTGLIITDCSEFHRLGDIDGDLTNLDTFIIDHHKTGDLPENSKGCINPSSPACALLVQRFYEELVGPLDLKTARNLFFGFCTDTGFFRFLTSDSKEVFEAVSRLVEAGADPKETYKIINGGKDFSTRKLLGILLQRAEKYLDGKLIITYETMEDTKKYGENGRDSDALYQLLLSSTGVEAVVFLRQDTVSTVTGGFRSQDKIDVSLVASKFGGGGHKNASGMSVNGKIDTILPQIVKEFAKII